MNLVEILFLAIALSIDALIVSFSYGLCTSKQKTKTALLLAFGVGFFQFLMPVLGWHFAKFIYNYIEAFAPIIAGIIFIILGLKFLYDALNKEDEKTKCKTLTLTNLFLISIATSIDALAAGCSIYFLKMAILLPSLVIGIITFMNSILGFLLGTVLKNIAPKQLEIIGALILILIGIKTIIF